MEAADAVIAVSGDAHRRAHRLPADRPVPGPGGLQRHRHHPVRAGPGHRRARPARHRPVPPQRGLRGKDHSAEGAALSAAGRRELPADTQLVLLAGAPDTAEIAAEVEELVAELRANRSGVVWVAEMLPKPEVIQVLTHATVFACPSIYEPMGIVNLEAMACETAVVATATGGIPEVVADDETGLLVPIEQVTDGSGTRWSRRSSSPTWLRRSTRCSPTRRAPPGSARPAGSAPWRTSPGTPSPGRHSTCTARSARPEEDRRHAVRRPRSGDQ
ncbi:glycosyltransferase [Micromonospora sp. M12]